MSTKACHENQYHFICATGLLVYLLLLIYQCALYEYDNCTHAPKKVSKPLLHCLLCFVAIKTGRYTYEKKTKIINEVKQLELARLAALPTQSSLDNVVALSKLPPQITDNKYELVIEQILAAYREHPLLEVNYFANIKQQEQTYLASACVLTTGSSV